MDYTNDPDGGAGGASSNDPSNEHPNAHDFVQLETVYDHLESPTPASSTNGNGRGRSDTADDEGPNNPAEFGRPAGPKDGYGRDILFVKDLPAGRKLYTHVFWVLSRTPNAPGHD
jgi:hypothetical protein